MTAHDDAIEAGTQALHGDECPAGGAAMSTVHYDAHGVTLHHGDSLDVLATLPDASVDAVVTDPPYGLGFMGKEWDTPGRAARATTTAIGKPNKGQFGSAEYGGASYGGDYVAGLRYFQDWCALWAAECLRVLKPGGHLLAFGGTRTWHRLACAIEDAGFEIRDSIAWMYGSGFPKSLDVSKAIDKAAGATREVVGLHPNPGGTGPRNSMGDGWKDAPTITAPATPEAARWAGWGTALKPAYEPVVVARKPLAGTVAANVLTQGTGALNVDGCRIEAAGRPLIVSASEPSAGIYGDGLNGGRSGGTASLGRWPANVVLDEAAAALLDQQSGESSGSGSGSGSGGIWSPSTGEPAGPTYGDSGGASRFFYTAKADSTERPRVNGTAHPTVKPLDLMRWLVRLVTPPGGTVLEPFAGSGTTVEACLLEGFRCIAIEREADYLPLIVARITRQRDPVAHVRLVGDDQPTLFDAEESHDPNA